MEVTTLADRTRQLPNGDHLVAAGWQLAGFGITRDSEPIEESNYSAAMRELVAAAGMTWDQVGDIGTPWAILAFQDGRMVWRPETDEERYPHPVGVAHFRHWACGWIDELMIRVDRPELVAKAAELAERVADYPLLDEDDYSERQWSADHPDSGECYAEGDCGCGR